MKKYSVILLFFLMACGAKEPFHSEVTFHNPPDIDTVRVFIPQEYIPPQLLTDLDSLQHINHLLRVEIDALKEENKLLKTTNELEENLESLKKEICKQ